jgi:FdhE protein
MTFESAVERLRGVARAAMQLDARLPNGVPDLTAVRVRLAEGIPALTGEPLIDWPTLVRSVRMLAGKGSDIETSLGPDTIVQATLTGSWESLVDHLSPETITLLDFAVRPVLRAGYVASRAAIAEATWSRGICPACGALPLLAELRPIKDETSRVLRCGRCSAAWSFARLTCPACGERDHTQLRYVHVDGEVDHRRAACCASCGFYIKEIARLDAFGDDAVFDVDLDTVGLDTLAVSAGYRRYA